MLMMLADGVAAPVHIIIIIIITEWKRNGGK